MTTKGGAQGHGFFRRQLRRRAHRTFVDGVLNHPTVARHLKRKQFRVLAARPADRFDRRHRATQPRSSRIVVYNYTDHHALEIAAPWLGRGKPRLKRLPFQPVPSHDEFTDAVRLLRRDKALDRALGEGRLVAYRPMPPLLQDRRGRTARERILNVGLLPTGRQDRHRIVSVNLSRREIVPSERAAPPRSAATDEVCPGNLPPDAGCVSTGQQVTEPLRVRWPEAAPLWEFEVLAPRGSSGLNGSGIELREVFYKGKRVLAQAHVPILNVKYEVGSCGPYRDWLYAETCFQCDGTSVPGHPEFRRAATPARTICESGSDAGNFTGVAIFEDGDELVLISECEAGWYRYIPEWRLHKDGSIRPRFKFSAISNSCVCNLHVHHAYWRLDFAIDTPATPDRHIVQYDNGTTWRTIRRETKQYRDAGHRRWRVANASTHHAYEIIPGQEDGTAKGDAYAKGDVWVLRWHPNEVDDGVPQLTEPSQAKLDEFVNGESVYKQDVVVWYAAHFKHEIGSGEHPGCHVVGPTLRPSVMP